MIVYDWSVFSFDLSDYMHDLDTADYDLNSECHSLIDTHISQSAVRAGPQMIDRQAR